MAADLTAPRPVPTPEERIRALVKNAEDVTADDSIPIRRYWSSARQILRMATVYFDEKNFERCFILYMKYIILFIEQLPKHPEYKQADPAEKAYVKNKCTQIIPLAEEVKLRIKARYQREYEAYLLEKEAYDRKLKERQLKQQREEEAKAEKQLREQKDQFLTNFQLELDRKKRELVEGSKRRQQPLSATSTTTDPSSPSAENGHQSDGDSLISDDDEDAALVPQLLNSLSLADAESSIHKPQIDRSTKPALPDFNTAGHLNELVVPYKSIINLFSNIAMANTHRNIETCAILAGKLSHSSFTITHLLVPKQSGTSDTCSAENEEEMMIEQERLELLTFGWIHTHPSQRAFLSSVDLHTHAPYQKMLPEAIAIVVAPNANEIGIYSLSEHGLASILRCRQKGFHPHPNESSLYGEAKHTRIDDSLRVQLVDFR